jgi:hypothetical protein
MMALSGVLAQFAEPPQEVEKVIEVPAITYMPPHTRGDKEFKGHGPRVYVQARLFVANGQLWVKVYMKAEETQEDWTTAEGEESYCLFRDKEVVRIAPGQDEATEWRYVDNNEEDDDSGVFAEGELVKNFICTGDTQGDDAGCATKVTSHFRPIKLIVKD